MLVTKKMLLALTLIGALVGAGIGALLTRTASTTSAADNSYNTAANTDRTQPVSYNTKTPEQIAAENGPQINTTAEQTAYREGFDAGYAACGTESTKSRATTTRTSYGAPRRSYTGASSRRAYYDYGTAPTGRSFWQKHRDKLTVAGTAATGAGIGALAGGKKGALIGTAVGAGSGALYTYKIRKRHRHRRRY